MVTHLNGGSRVLIIACSLCAVIAANIHPVRADIVLPGSTQVSSGITVSGHSEAKVKPDVAYVTLTVETTDPDEATAVRDNATKMQAVNDALTKSNISAGDIQTQSYSVWPNRDYSTNPPVLTGYTATTTLLVTIHDIAKAGVIVDKVSQLDATVGDITYDLVDKSQVEGEQLVAAVANARSKADLIAGAAGVQVGRVISVTEQSGTEPMPQPLFRMSAMAMAPGAAQPTTQFSPQQIDVSADVTATYSIQYPSN